MYMYHWIHYSMLMHMHTCIYMYTYTVHNLRLTVDCGHFVHLREQTAQLSQFHLSCLGVVEKMSGSNAKLFTLTRKMNEYPTIK